MNGTTIEKGTLTKAALALYDEAYLEAPNPKGTWFTDNGPKCGTLGLITHGTWHLGARSPTGKARIPMRLSSLRAAGGIA